MNIVSIQGFPDDEKQYPNKTGEEQQTYWNGLFFDFCWKDENRQMFPIHITQLREMIQRLHGQKNSKDPKDQFLPKLIDTLLFFFDTIEEMFILDDEAKAYLYEHSPELLNRHGGADIQKFVHDTKNNINNSLQNNE